MYGYKVTEADGYRIIETELATYFEPMKGYDHCNHCGEMAKFVEVMDENLEWLTLCNECANTLMKAGD